MVRSRSVSPVATANDVRQSTHLPASLNQHVKSAAAMTPLNAAGYVECCVWLAHHVLRASGATYVPEPLVCLPEICRLLGVVIDAPAESAYPDDLDDYLREFARANAPKPRPTWHPGDRVRRMGTWWTGTVVRTWYDGDFVTVQWDDARIPSRGRGWKCSARDLERE